MQQNELQEQQATEAQKISNEELQLHKVTTLHSDKVFNSDLLYWSILVFSTGLAYVIYTLHTGE